jgi:putative restriction endonuclease
MLDTAVFKKLAHNDTGAAPGHQGGIVIPKAIAPFFPPLPGVVRGSGPTVESFLTADLFVDGLRVATVRTRYQHQTWGGTRSPERRLTDNLGALRNLASKDDILLFSKDLNDDGYIRLDLIRRSNPAHAALDARTGGQRWGPTDPSNPPVSLDQIAEAEADVDAMAAAAASAFDRERPAIETVAVRRARDRAFRRRVMDQYGGRCAFSGQRFASPVDPGNAGLDAAHVVPVAAGGSDHPGNGLPLTKDLHWSLDRGLVGVAENRTILVPPAVRALPGNELLAGLHGHPIREARDEPLRVLEEALAWHRTHTLLT